MRCSKALLRVQIKRLRECHRNPYNFFLNIFVIPTQTSNHEQNLLYWMTFFHDEKSWVKLQRKNRLLCKPSLSFFCFSALYSPPPSQAQCSMYTKSLVNMNSFNTNFTNTILWFSILSFKARNFNRAWKYLPY